MKLRELLADDKAVSPVIGVILMVAITVILAAVIGTFVLGLGDQVSSSTPQVSFTFSFDESSTSSDCGSSLGANTLTITHDGGDKLDGSNLKVTDGTNTVSDVQSACSVSDLTAGTQFSVLADSSDTIRIIWTNPNGGDTNTLAKWEGPDA